MALTGDQQDQVDALKRLVGATGLEDDDLYDYVVAAGGELNAAASAVWGYKAATAADLIDVKEGSSTRSLSQLRASALAMQDRYAAAAAAVTPPSSGATKIGAVTR